MPSSDAIRALVAGLGRGATDLAGSMRARDEKRASAEAALRQIAMQDALHKANLAKLDAETRKLLQGPQAPPPPQTVGKGVGVRQPDGSYKVEVPDAPPPVRRTLVRDKNNRMVSVDPNTGLDAQGKPVEAYVPPRAVPRPRALPATAVDNLVALDDLTGMADEVSKLLNGAIADKVDVTGRVGGMLREPNWVMNARGKGGDRGKDIRTAMGNLYSTLAKQRGGTALSENELALLETFLPNKDEDEATALVKTNRFLRQLKIMKANKLAGYQKYAGVDMGADEAPPNPVLPNPDY